MIDEDDDVTRDIEGDGGDELIAAEREASEYQTLAQGFLTPRHRRLAQLAAEGRANSDIMTELGYTGSRVSILLRNPFIAAEVRRLQDLLFEETVTKRLKSFAEPALNNIQKILTDRTGRIKTSEMADMSKWVVEKLDGKPAQKTDIGENLLGVLLDRLDARKVRPQPQREVRDSAPDIEVLAISAPPPVAERPTEEDELTSWVEDFSSKA